MEKENSTEEEPMGFPAPKNVKEADHNINVPTTTDLSDDERVGTVTDAGEERLEQAPYVHEDDQDIKPSTTTSTEHLSGNEQEIVSSSKRHLADAEIESTSNDMEIRNQEDDKLSDDITSSSSVRFSNSENLVSTHGGESDVRKEDTSSSVGPSNFENSIITRVGEPDIQKEDQGKGNSTNDVMLNSSAAGIKISGQEDDNFSDNSSSSSRLLSNSGNLINNLTGEEDIQIEDQEKGNCIVDDTSSTADDIELRARVEDNFTTSSSSSSPSRLSSSENSINELAREPDIQGVNHEKGSFVRDAIHDYNAKESEILDHVEDKNDTGQSPKTTIVNHQCYETIELKSKDVSDATFSSKDGESSSFKEKGDMKTDPADNNFVPYGTRELNVEAETAAQPEKTSVLTKFVKFCAASNIFRHLSRGTDNDSNEKDNSSSSSSSNGSIKADSQQVSHTTPEKSRWSLSSLSLISISNYKKSEQKELGCEKCKEARKILRKRRLRYSEINIDIYPSRKVELEDMTGSSDVPKVFFNQFLIDGLKKLKRLDESGQLEKKIEYVTNEGPSPQVPLPPLSGEDDVSTVGGIDELAVIVRKMKKSIVVKDRFYKFRRVTSCFLGSEAVDFLSEDQLLEREVAIEFARKLAKELFFRHKLIYSLQYCVHKPRENTFEDGNHLYRFLDQDPVISQCQNIPRGIIQRKRQNLVKLSHRLRFLLYAILDAYTSEDGKHVAYRSFHGSEEFARYLRIAEELQRLDLYKTSKEERLAFFINLYNLMTIHAILVWGHPEGALDRRSMYNDFKYVIGGCAYSLSDIQNGILRANQRPPYALSKPFSISDKRFKVALPYLEPLIHFALVTGNRSAPALRCYSPKNIDRELMEAASDFLQSGAFVLHLDSMYSVDFGKNEAEILKHAAMYLEFEKTRTLMELLDSTQLKVFYQPYDWRLNS
ncbi:hypothetical protein M8C21_025218 [Ambrosia artemisiifolia]|uniref:DEP domain-containing protein n=1 Tax=Ambrosia artemisiifolia TaxID=4212 RepID=A0AAD5BY89_AMBAR|nr:hypothetical protein M8C21_025218 [Ambrosia artemisiifolia]